MSTNIGKVVQVIGPVVDILFAAGNLPAIYNAIHIKKTNEEGKEETIVVEIYDGPHYPQKPDWYTDERDAH